MNLNKLFLNYCKKNNLETNHNQLNLIEELKLFYNQNFNKSFLKKIFTKQNSKKGFYLEDGEVIVDDIQIVNNSQNKELLITLHSGRNRIVRRIFEFFEYKVIKLDRIVFAGISKKKVVRGKWRFLNKKEIGFLKMK